MDSNICNGSERLWKNENNPDKEERGCRTHVISFQDSPQSFSNQGNVMLAKVVGIQVNGTWGPEMNSIHATELPRWVKGTHMVSSINGAGHPERNKRWASAPILSTGPQSRAKCDPSKTHMNQASSKFKPSFLRNVVDAWNPHRHSGAHCSCDAAVFLGGLHPAQAGVRHSAATVGELGGCRNPHRAPPPRTNLTQSPRSAVSTVPSRESGTSRKRNKKQDSFILQLQDYKSRTQSKKTRIFM